ncbi:unnamed protein product [Effrenium voratum]|uniref:Thioredoxin domain-containing protein n=1 Tax=Effrenium voratum TaxID=2562239 RepID=A0AA36IL16_9DINO|nr:unnamed protein product [Effrenium voratum]
MVDIQSATCKRVNQAKPVVIDLDDAEDPGALPQDPGDDFADLVAHPAATREPIPARVPKAEIPPFTPAGREGLTVGDLPEALEKEKRPRDTASALSMSSSMTSSAAALLGGLTAKPADKPDTSATPATTRPGDSKSVLASSTAMKSSAASSLGALFAKQSDARSRKRRAWPPSRRTPSKTDEAKPEPKRVPGKAKSVLAQSTVMSSSAAGALSGLLAKAPAARPDGEEASSSPDPATASSAPQPKRSAAAKSVLNQSTVMSSSAAGALSGLLAKAPAARPDGEEASSSPDPATASSAPQPKRSAAAKSVLNQSTVMSSSAAGALSGLLAKAPAARPDGEEASSSPDPATASSAPQPKRSAAAKSVLNQSTVMSSSAAGALSGLLAKAPAARPDEASASTQEKPKTVPDSRMTFSGLGAFLRRHPKKFGLGALCLCGFAAWPGSFEHTVREDRVKALNEKLAQMSPTEMLQWAVKTGDVLQFSSFGPSGMVIIDMLAASGLLEQIPVVMIDTLHLFPETYEHVLNVTRRYPTMKLHVYYPLGFGANEAARFDSVHGAALWKDNFDQYSFHTKVEPTSRALRELSPGLWVTGRRRSQGGAREKLPLLEKDAGRLKMNPLAFWDLSDVWNYIHAHRVPYNVLHDRGYSSIGDVMNTRPVQDGESERAGRFQASGATECGMHTHLARVAALRQKPKAQLGNVPHLPCDACVEVDPQNFEEVVLRTQQDLLLEFYSPHCSHCVQFAPVFAAVATRLAKDGDVISARFDLFRHLLPETASQAGIQVSAFPTLILVRRSKTGLKVLPYPKWRRDLSSVLNWVKEQAASAKPKARPGESKTVVTGLNTSSSAAALLGGMVQAKK